MPKFFHALLTEVMFKNMIMSIRDLILLPRIKIKR